MIDAAQQVDSVAEVIVVSDGSSDKTAAVSTSHGAKVVELPSNQGKSAAMKAGLEAASQEIVLFLDADLVGLKEEHVERLIAAYQPQEVDMVVGVFSNGRMNTDLAQRINPFASGQRVISKALWERAKENVREMNYGIEIALSRLAAKEGWRSEKVKLDGVTHILKEEKRGFAKGVLDRMKMYGDMIKWLVKKV